MGHFKGKLGQPLATLTSPAPCAVLSLGHSAAQESREGTKAA